MNTPKFGFAPRIFYWLLIGVLLTPLPNYCLGYQPGPADWRITSEAELATLEKQEEIDKVWRESAKESKFTTADGIGIAYMTLRHPQNRERGAVVISAGRTESYIKYRELAYDIFQNQFSVYIHDHRGQGLSDRLPQLASQHIGHVNDFDEYVKDLSHFMSTVVESGNHNNIYLLGHSMGSAIAARLLENDGALKTRLSAVALFSPMFKIKGIAQQPADLVSCRIARFQASTGNGKLFVTRGKDYSPLSFEENLYTTSPIRYKRLLEAYGITPRARLGSPSWNWMSQACSAAKAAREGAALIKVPTIVLISGKDAIVHNQGAFYFCNKLKSSMREGCGGRNGDPILIPHAKHELLIESDQFRTPALEAAFNHFSRHRRN